MLAKLRHFVPEKTLYTLFNAFIQPHIDYGLTAWGSASNTHLSLIHDSLEKSIRIISFKGKNEPSTPLFKKHKILPLEKNITYQQCKFIWKCVNTSQPPAIQDLFEQTQKDKQNARNNKLFRPFCRTSTSQKFVLNAGIKFWNSIPPNIRNNKLNPFTDRLKSHLLDSLQ